MFPPGDINTAADPNLCDEEHFSPLLKAIECAFIKGIQLLLKAGADINYNHPETHETPLHSAIEMNSEEMVHILTHTKNIDVNAATTNGGTPLHLAIKNVNLGIFNLLMKHGKIDLLQLDSKGNSVLHIAL